MLARTERSPNPGPPVREIGSDPIDRPDAGRKPTMASGIVRRMNLWSVVVAGGSGTRFGRLKQLEPLAGRRVLDWSVDAMERFGPVVLVVPAEHAERADLPGTRIVAGGTTRSESVRAGLAACGDARR